MVKKKAKVLKKASKKKVGRPRKATKAGRQARKSADMLLVVSKTKEAIKGHQMNLAADALDQLNRVVHWYISEAAQRAEANGRKTIRGHDFMAG